MKKARGADAPTFCAGKRLSGLEESQCHILPGKDDVPIRVAERSVIFRHTARARIRDTPKTRAIGDEFLAGGTHAKERSDELVKEPLVPCGASFPPFFRW